MRIQQIEMRAQILAGLTLVIRGAGRQGGDPLYIAGVLDMAEYQAQVNGLDWKCILDDCQASLGLDLDEEPLIERATSLEAGARVKGESSGESM